MTIKPVRLTREYFRAWIDITTRWGDNDQYGHVNNVQYYSFFDTAVNQWLIQKNLLDPANGTLIGLVVQSHCDFHDAVSFPGVVQAGVRVAQLGCSSVRYEIGLFLPGKMLASASGYFIHVYVDRLTRRPVELPATWREPLEALLGSA
jgi:acyl-CoA thioester hydrolase